MEPITNIVQLKTLLEANNIDISLYGKGEAKTLQQLFNEIQNKETTLLTENDTLKRQVRVLLIELQREDGKILREVRQYWHPTPEREAYTRERNCLIAEKLYNGEDADSKAINRALSEELGLPGLTLTGCLLEQKVEERYSQSYPGLCSCYVTYHVKALAPKAIPTVEFTNTEYYDDKTPRVTSTWSWL